MFKRPLFKSLAPVLALAAVFIVNATAKGDIVPEPDPEPKPKSLDHSPDNHGALIFPEALEQHRKLNDMLKHSVEPKAYRDFEAIRMAQPQNTTTDKK